LYVIGNITSQDMTLLDEISNRSPYEGWGKSPRTWIL